MSVGFLGLLVELRTPGWGVAGTAGLIAIMLFFGSHYIVRLAGVGELILFAAGIILLTLEVMVIPGFGVAGIAGISLIVASLYLSLVGRLPHPGDYRIAAVTVMSAFILTVAGAVAAVKLLPRSSMYRKLVLHTVEDAGDGYLSAESDTGYLGGRGTALNRSAPFGQGRDRRYQTRCGNRGRIYHSGYEHYRNGGARHENSRSGNDDFLISASGTTLQRSASWKL